MSQRPTFNGVINRVNLVGVELEGGWDARPSQVYVPNGVVRDGSVVFERPEPYYDGNGKLTIDKTAIYPKFAVGEAVSTPLAVERTEEWMRVAYPQHVNDTCGLHVHMSFHHKLNYSRVMTPDYMQFLVRELKTFGKLHNIPEGPFWNRLDPTHPWTQKHCAHIYLGDRQVLVAEKDYNSRGKEHSRYTFVNYPDRQHQTVECRGLPMFGTPGKLVTKEDVDLAVAAVHAVITATNRFLSKIRTRERQVQSFVDEGYPIMQEIGQFVR